MVQSSTSVRFDKSDPTVFYYEQFQHNYEDTKIALRNLNITGKNRNILNLEQDVDLIFKDSISELDLNAVNTEESQNDVFQLDIDKIKDLNAEDTEIVDSDRIDSNSFVLDSDSTTFRDADAELSHSDHNEQKVDANRTKSTSSEDKITNATYFYRILHHLIDVGSDGTRFKCCNRSPTKLCDSCKVIDKLMFTYFDLTTMDDVVEERVKRGICGYLYCCNPITKSGSKSKYKIDIISKNIYKREEYESFCSVLCLEESEKVMKRAAQSPVETGAFTPRAMRSADNKTLKTLHDNVFSLPSCSSELKSEVEQGFKVDYLTRSQFDQLGLGQMQQANAVDLGSIPPELFDKLNESSQRKRLGKDYDEDSHDENDDEDEGLYDADKKKNKDKETKDSKDKAEKDEQKEHQKSRREMVDTFEIYEDFESCDSDSESSISEVNVKFDKDVKNLKSIYKSCHPDRINGDEKQEKNKSKENKDKKKTKEKVSFVDHESLGIFSLLWYIMSNMITNNTRDLVNSGIIQKYEFHEEFHPLYESCLRDLPNILLPTFKLHVQHLLSTFKPVKDNLLNEKIVQPLSYVIKYVILMNRHHLPFSYNDVPDQKRMVDGLSSEKCETDLGSVKNKDDMERLDEISNYDKDNEELKEINYQLLLEKVENILQNQFQLDHESLDILAELFVEL